MLPSERMERMRGWLVAHRPGLATSAIGDDTDLIDSGIVDSLQLIEFVLFLEQERGKPILSDAIDPASLRSLAAIERSFFA